MNPKPKATHQQQAAAEQQHTPQGGVHEFADPDQMIAYDATTTEVPAKIERRIQRTLGPAKVSWWKRLFGA